MRILVIGGYGAVGTALGAAILSGLDAGLVVAGPDLDRARRTAAQLASAHPGQPVEARRADLHDRDSLLDACAGVDLVVVAATAPEQIAAVAEAALAAGADLVDILLRADVVDRLTPLAPRFTARGRVAITQAGFHPGLPAALIRAAAAQLDRIRTAEVSMAMNARFARPASAAELVHVLGAEPARILTHGLWRGAGWRDSRRVDFGEGFGTLTCYPIRMREIEGLVIDGLEEAGVWTAGFNPVTDNLVLPLIMAVRKVAPGAGCRLFPWLLYQSVRAVPRGAPGVVLRIEATGWRAERPVRLVIEARSDDAVAFTAEAVLAALKQWAQGRFAPGLHLMGRVVDPDRLLGDLKERGVAFSVAFTDLGASAGRGG